MKNFRSELEEKLIFQQGGNVYWENLQDIECICLEIQYQKYIRSDRDEEHRFVSCKPGWTSDLKNMVGINFEKNEIKTIRRAPDLSYKVRQGNALRFHEYFKME